MIPVYKPYLTKQSIEYAEDAIKSTWISSHGKYIDMVKDKLITLSGSKHVILTNNGTSATHLTAIGLKHKHPNIKNIITPNNVYVAAWNSFKMNPTYNIIPIDCNINTWNINYDDVHQTLDKGYDKTNTAFLVVHNLGNIINVPKLKKEYGDYIFIEDNCEGFLGKYDNKPSGCESLLSSVSFFGNKTITSGEGGAVFTDDIDLFTYLDSVKSQGVTTTKFKFDKLGYNYRMTNVQAAILLGQIECLDEILDKKNRVFNKYKENLSDFEGIEFQKIEKNTTHSKWVVGIRFTNLTHKELKDLELFLYENYIETRPMFPPITYHDHFKDIKSEISIAKNLYEQVLIFPSYPDLRDNEINRITNTIKNYLKK